MPAKTPPQQRFMAMCKTSKGRKKAKGKCPSVKVAKEFSHKGYSHGGHVDCKMGYGNRRID